jgi:hypothetical protein
MRIRNTELMQVRPPRHGAGLSAAAVSGKGFAKATAMSPAHASSEELRGFLELVRRAPEIRLELLAQVQQRLAGGAYLTYRAGLYTAEAVLESPDC